jgi:hypothetical protein
LSLSGLSSVRVATTGPVLWALGLVGRYASVSRMTNETSIPMAMREAIASPSGLCCAVVVRSECAAAPSLVASDVGKQARMARENVWAVGPTGERGGFVWMVAAVWGTCWS